MSIAQCAVCPRACRREEGQVGFCGARRALSGHMVSISYGKLTAVALDPIEKKPLRRFCPGTNILSVGSFGCNLRCPHCQNYSISMCTEQGARYTEVSPDMLVRQALQMREQGNVGIALTYNEPIIGVEYAVDVFARAREEGLKTVMVTNGYASEHTWDTLLALTDALNIDLKAFSPAFYKKIGGDLDIVKRNIERAAARCHVEVTTLVIPGENDSPDEMDAQAKWLSGVGRDIPLHISRFFPHYKKDDIAPTPSGTVDMLAGIASKYLEYVYKGNM